MSVMITSGLSSAAACDVLRSETPFAIQPTTLIFKQSFISSIYVAPTLSATPTQTGMTPAVPFTPAKGPYFVLDGPRQDLKGGLLKWERTWAHIPMQRVENPPLNYSAQSLIPYTVQAAGYVDSFGIYHGMTRTTRKLKEWVEPLVATVTFDYVLTIKKALALLNYPYRVTELSDLQGLPQFYITGSQGIAEVTDPKRWMGDIFEVKNVFINPSFAVTIQPGNTFAGVPTSGPAGGIF
jgi:hypothetical protein